MCVCPLTTVNHRKNQPSIFESFCQLELRRPIFLTERFKNRINPLPSPVKNERGITLGDLVAELCEQQVLEQCCVC